LSVLKVDISCYPVRFIAVPNMGHIVAPKAFTRIIAVEADIIEAVATAAKAVATAAKAVVIIIIIVTLF